ncbi:MAG: CDP-glucose 4,6-dehydratase [Rhodospirillales bacterium]|nr:CDP-glucose 4,6-dehydratase [Rhodospirillales bacterium]USO08548.1 MAG: CDP-glucose 4,6-dehydratase [Rhodospirillales bacterium]
MGVNAEFWRGRRVFLTGHTGFKGGWLSLWLRHMGAEVTGYALAAPGEPNLFTVADVARDMNSITGDVRDAAVLARAMRDARPEIVIHMAAQSLVRLSYAQPVETYATNVMGSVHLFEAVRASPGVRAVVNVTSDKCYENREQDYAYREDDAMGGFDPYSSSKGCAELVSAAYRNSFFPVADYARHGVAVATARAGNVIGGGDWAVDRLIPDMVRAFGAGEAVVIRAPDAVRPWQHVLEPLAGYLTLAQALYASGPEFAQGWNFGPDAQDARPVGYIVEKMAGLWGDGATWTLDARAQPHEAHLLTLDSGKAHEKLGWRGVWTLDAALERIVAWHKAHLAGADMRARTLGDIDAYMQRVAGGGR